jgi:hypothetical protein
MINAQLNRKLHALAGGISPGEAHKFLKEISVERYSAEYSNLTESQVRDLVIHLRQIKDKVRTNIYRALNGAEGSPITEEQISKVREYKKLLGWSEDYMWKLINNRYGETSLESMPSWKAFRLVGLMQKRWHSKKKQSTISSENE